MRILFLTEMFPDTIECGARLMTVNRIREYVKEGHSVCLVSFFTETINISSKESIEILKIVDQSFILDSHFRSKLNRKLRTILCRNFIEYSDKYKNKYNVAFINSLLEKNNFDFLHIEGLTVYPLVARIKEIKPIPKIIFANDEKYLAYKRAFPSYNLIQKVYQSIIARRFLELEKSIAKKHTIVFVSDIDSESLKEHVSDGKIITIRNGIDLNYFNPNEDFPNQESDEYIVFTGNMNFGPNINAILWFYNNVWNEFQKRHSHIKLYIVGNNPSPEIIKLKSKNVVVTGRVEDIRPYIYNAKIFIAPLQDGSGIKNKVLEAFALKKCVLGTKMAFEAIPELQKNYHCVIADTPESFLVELEKLVDDDNLNRNISENAYEFVKSNFSWTTANLQIMDLVNEKK